MFIRLKLKNWRSIDDATIELASFTVIVGRNSSGKSNIVDSLLFSSELGRDAATAVSRRGGITSIRRWSPSRPYDVAVEWRVAATAAQLDTDYTRHAFVLRSGKDGAWNFHREDVEVVAEGRTTLHVERTKDSLKLTQGTTAQLGLFEEKLPESTSAFLLARQLGWIKRSPQRRHPWLSSVRAMRPVPEEMRKPQPPSESPRLAEDGRNIATSLRAMSAEERRGIVDAMQRIVPGLVDVQGVPAGRYLTLVFTQAQSAEAEHRPPEFLATEMSDGALRALAVVVAAQQMERDELLVIEEPEVNLHPGAADVVYDVLHRASKRGAVLVTTHSPEILDRAVDDRILVCQYVDGVTKVGELSGDQRQLVREGLFTTAELMRSEELRREGAEPAVVLDLP